MSNQADRPLSPHLQIYRWQLTMTLSILHRFAGVALAVGLIAVTWMLLAAIMGPEAWGQFTGFFTSILGKVMLMGWIAALFYHLCNGVRHLIWDTGHLLSIRGAYRAGYIVLLVAAGLTLFFWNFIFQ